MSGFDVHWLSGTLALPLWALGAGAAVFVFVLVLAVHRPGIGARAAVLGRNALILLALLLGGGALDRFLLQERFAARWPNAEPPAGSAAQAVQQSAEREALQARARELTSRGLAPGSALACLANGAGAAGDAVEAACEKAVFASAETTAAAVAFTAERLMLLADSLDYAQRVDAGFAASLEPWRHAVESDRFGLVAQVLASRDGCTADTCNRFALFRDASVVKSNLRARTYEGLVAQYSETWKHPSEPAAAVAAAAPGAPRGPLPVVRNIDFPSSTSIPQISIMAPEPAGPPGGAPGATTGSVAPAATAAKHSASEAGGAKPRHAPSPNGAQANTRAAPAAKPPASPAAPAPAAPAAPAPAQPGEAGQ